MPTLDAYAWSRSLKLPRANKDHDCDDCKAKIKKGTIYKLAKWQSAGRWYQQKSHLGHLPYPYKETKDGSFICLIDGTLVADIPRHIRWHSRVERF
jgi:hypothetical protein